MDDDINTDNDQDIDGLLYGVAVGYDFDLGGVVAGVDAEYSRLDRAITVSTKMAISKISVSAGSIRDVTCISAFVWARASVIAG